MNEHSVDALTSPLEELATRHPAIHPAGLPGDAVEAATHLEALLRFGIPDSPAMRLVTYPQVIRDPANEDELAIGEAVNHRVMVDVRTGQVWATPLSEHLTSILFVNSSVGAFTEALWRWASIAPVLEELSHEVASLDVSEDFILYTNKTDPPPHGVGSLWRAWAEIR